MIDLPDVTPSEDTISSEAGPAEKISPKTKWHVLQDNCQCGWTADTKHTAVAGVGRWVGSTTPGLGLSLTRPPTSAAADAATLGLLSPHNRRLQPLFNVRRCAFTSLALRPVVSLIRHASVLSTFRRMFAPLTFFQERLTAIQDTQDPADMLPEDVAAYLAKQAHFDPARLSPAMSDVEHNDREPEQPRPVEDADPDANEEVSSPRSAHDRRAELITADTTTRKRSLR